MEGTLIEGKTIDEAIEKACSEFQVPREKLNIEIIAEGNSGFLGIGAKKAMIRASLMSIDMTIDTLFAREETSHPARTERPPEQMPPEVKREVSGGAGSAAGSGVKQPQPAHKPRPSSQPRQAIKPKAPAPSPEPAPSTRPHPATTALPGDGEPPARKAQRVLEGLLTHMQIPSPVDLEETEEAIILNIRGDGSGLLIGKRGQNLDAIQYIVNKAVHHTANGNKMIIIDTEEYRKRREESLVALAVRLGEKVKKTKKPVTVGHMNAHDRRIIHMVLQEDESLTTQSRGEGKYRKIVILPAKTGNHRRIREKKQE